MYILMRIRRISLKDKKRKSESRKELCVNENLAVVKVRGARGFSPLLPFEPPCCGVGTGGSGGSTNRGPQAPGAPE